MSYTSTFHAVYSPLAMTVVLLVGFGFFARTALRRWRLMALGPSENRWDHLGERLRRTWRYAIVQERMRRYPLAGFAHMAIFLGFVVLLPRTLMLWGRGYSPGFDFWTVLGRGSWVGSSYLLLKDTFVFLVIIGASIFLYFRVFRRLGRLTLNFEGLLILLIILSMMFADVLHDGAEAVLQARAADRPVHFAGAEPLGSVAGLMLANVGIGALNVLSAAGFWTHVCLVLLFLNLLPVSKHFHIITAVPNVFTQNLTPRGRLPKTEDIEGKIEREETLGLARIDQLTWKGVLDLYTCTECGRCSDYCPATRTGKLLSPKHFTIDLRDHLYSHESELIAAKRTSTAAALVSTPVPANPQPAGAATESATRNSRSAMPLVPGVINPEVLWACTTCRACEQECPVFITYVDKIVDMRRNLVMERSEFPEKLQNAFRGIESNANPWNFPASDRAAWTSGLHVPLMRDKGQAEYLFWVGCSGSFDDRAKKITRATAQLLNQAGVDYAILGDEERCTGDPARRAGNEFLFQMMAAANIEILNNYKVKKIVTTCPHCYNTLANEYPDFGGHYELIHHTELLAQLIREGRLIPKSRIEARVAYHDSCYLGRYNDIYDPPRDALRAIPGLTVLEPAATRDRGMCCGAGGAQMFKEEEKGTARVNIARTEQLLDTAPAMVASACPFCQRMLVDGLSAKHRDDVAEMDVAELLWKSVGGES